MTEVKLTNPDDNPSEPARVYPSSEDPECAYLLNEANVFNNRIIWYLEQQQKQEIFALGASGVLWAYLMQNPELYFAKYVSILPVLIAAALAFKSSLLTKTMKESMDYLYSLEAKFDANGKVGWVHFYRKSSSNYKRKWRRLFWSAIVIVNVIFCVIYYNAFSMLSKPTVVNPPKHNVVVTCKAPPIKAETCEAKGTIEEPSTQKESNE